MKLPIWHPVHSTSEYYIFLACFDMESREEGPEKQREMTQYLREIRERLTAKILDLGQNFKWNICIEALLLMLLLHLNEIDSEFLIASIVFFSILYFLVAKQL